MIFINKIDAPTVLLVDADFDQSLASKSELEAQGYRVVCAYSGEEAFTTFAREKIDAIVVDAMLPDMHVLDFVDEIAATRSRNTSIIINNTYPGYKQNFRYWAADAVVDNVFDSRRELSGLVAALR